jgi:hypothetical protein
MAELLLVILEVIAEVVLQGLAEIPFDWALNKREKRAHTQDRPLRPLFWAIIAIITGAGFGWLTHQLYPTPWPTSQLGRIAFLTASPLLVGASSYLFNRSRTRRGQDWTRPWIHAGCATAFALSLAVTRTLLTSVN